MISNEHSSIRQGDEIDIIAALRVVWRYKFFVVSVAVLCAAIAVFIALSTIPIYRAETVVTEARAEGMNGPSSLVGQLGGLASIAGINLGKAGMGYEAQAILRSRHLAEEFVRRNDLVAQLLPEGSKSRSLWFAVNRFRESVMSLRDEKDAGTTTISIEWTDPAIAALWANQFASLANELIRARALEESSRNIKYLNEQIAKTDVVEIQRLMYELIENETKKHMLANGREQYAFTIVDPAAVPEQRIWPRRTLMVLTGGVLGVFIGIGLALLHSAWSSYRKESKAVPKPGQAAHWQ